MPGSPHTVGIGVSLSYSFAKAGLGGDSLAFLIAGHNQVHRIDRFLISRDVHMQPRHASFAGGQIFRDVECPNDDAIALERRRIVIRRIAEIRIVAALDADDLHLSRCRFKFQFSRAQLRPGRIDEQVDRAEARRSLLGHWIGCRLWINRCSAHYQDEPGDKAAGDAHGFSPPLIFTAENATTSTSLLSIAPSWLKSHSLAT